MALSNDEETLGGIMMTRRNSLIAKQSQKTNLITWSSETKPFGTFVGHEYGYGRDGAPML